MQHTAGSPDRASQEELPGPTRWAWTRSSFRGVEPAAYLDHAVTLARAAKCSLVILCSHYLQGREVKEYLDARSFSGAIVIDLPSGYSHPLFNFRRLLDIKDQLPPEISHHVTDLSMKRNIGLVLAKMLGWRRIFFLDDDIRDIAYPDLQRTVDMLGSYSAAGMWVTEFPDNSIVCHANRMTGGSQDVFASGAALAVDCASDIGFFPDIYNEDWLFFFDAASEGKLGNSYLKATQLYYYPFANADRAAWQEFGDVLAEGLYTLLHLEMNIAHATTIYWSFFREARREFLEATHSRAQDAPLDIRHEITASLQSALKCLTGIDSDLLARYVEAWRNDLADWKIRWAEIRVMSSVDEALAELGLVITPADNTRRILHPLDRAKLLLEPGQVIIPKFDALRKMEEHFASERLSSQRADEKWSAKLLAILPHQHGRHRRQRLLNASVDVGVFHRQSLATRLFSLAKMGAFLSR